jgi:4-diphosphocytidyl-2-C-methyl-D-erythritol kinase
MADEPAWSAWPAPAKLNLFLHVTGRRPDGYHELQTAFQLLDFGDEIRLRARCDGRIVRHGAVPGVAAVDDLAVRAAGLLAAAHPGAPGVDIALDKRIPLGGGLGGGSSDAATVLVALDQLWSLGLSQPRLDEFAVALGADVPVFVHGRSAWAEGIGERLVPLDLPPAWFVVLDAGARVSTAEIFQAPELTRNSAPTTISRFLAGEATRNDLEPVVRARYPRVAAALDWLGALAPARMTGSGGCVFATVRDETTARRIAERCPAPWTAFVARGVAESPLLAVARSAQGGGRTVGSAGTSPSW